MELFITVLILLALIGVSNVINHKIPFVPVPLIQIALGSAIPLLASDIHLHLEPELFFVLFIAPLLYNDGKHTPRSELWRLRVPIFLLAVGLVFATVLVVGYIIHWMIPSIPLPVAFGLAAILSPTDAVAVGALAGRIHLPKRLMHLLEGEALMNDASGLVAFKFAIAAAVTGVFSLSKASGSFLVIFVGGLAVGAVLAAIITGVRAMLRRAGLENETMHMLIHILTPFALFLIAEELGLSGILAAVAGGVVHAIERDHAQKIKSRSHELSDNTWTIIVYLLNGLVFVILGVQLPDVFHAVFVDSAYNNAEVIGFALIIYILLIVLRFLWVFAYSRFNHAKKAKFSFKMLMMTSFSGVRGAVTLAGAFTIPLVLDNGDPFPERSLVIFLSAFVILFSLLAASILLPLLAKSNGTNAEAETAKKEHAGYLAMTRSAIQAVRRATTEENKGEAAAVIAEYERWIRQSQLHKDRQRNQKEVAIRLRALEIEHDVIRHSLRNGAVAQRHADVFLKNLDEIELIVSDRMHMGHLFFKRIINGIKLLFKNDRQMSIADRVELKKMKLRTSVAVIEALEEAYAPSIPREAADVIDHYCFIKDHCSSTYPAARGDENRKRDLQWIAIQAERDEVQSLYDRNEISREVATGLRRDIRNREATILESE
ncbi:Na+/H+ antiporter [Cohnella nanjingensis]|uniref:Na+/H+ antiporter n=1 Tax=Cohnella nanjingensis TaxID=1387779 RepID=A0A7X0RL57_9BACL|nr:Na+/H+ antiporter [Cohnella nanjingensis]MBB6669539.1 Na+/H+ antiporter [Cohnella nanjingensis]